MERPIEIIGTYYTAEYRVGKDDWRPFHHDGFSTEEEAAAWIEGKQKVRPDLYRFRPGSCRIVENKRTVIRWIERQDA